MSNINNKVKQTFNPKLIYNFRVNYLQKYEEYYTFPDKNNKNRWNKMCSCVDWIEQVINYFNDGIDMDEGISYNSVKIYNFIMDLDLLCSNVIELWRSFNKENPFHNTRNVFNASFLKKNITDHEYWEIIRAFFGTHSSNGNPQKLEINGVQLKDVRFFSSYSTKMNDEIIVFMYSNYDKAEKLIETEMKVNIFDLLRYSSLQYNSIKKLENEINKHFQKVDQNIQKSIDDIALKEIPVTNKIYLMKKNIETTYKRNVIISSIDFYLNSKDVSLEELPNSDSEIIKKYLNVLDDQIVGIYKRSISNSNEMLDYMDDKILNPERYSKNYNKKIDTMDSQDEDAILKAKLLVKSKAYFDKERIDNPYDTTKLSKILDYLEDGK